MHERSLTMALFGRVLEAAAGYAPETVRSIVVENGELSGVDSQLVRESFEELKLEFGLNHSTLDIRDCDLVLECTECLQSFHPEKFDMRCPACITAPTRLVQGDAFRLVSFDVVESVAGPTSSR